jgi:glycosyltransferase involved in cell wall biosynthesis
MKNILYFASNLDFNLSNGASIVEYEQIKLLQPQHKIKVINFIDDKSYLNQKVIHNLDYQEIELKKNIFGQPEYPKTIPNLDNNYDFVVFTSSYQVNLVPLFTLSKKIYVINNTDYQQNKHAFLNVDNKEENLCGMTDINIFLTQKDFLYFKSLGLIRKNDLIISPFINNKFLTDTPKILNQALITTNLDNKHNQESLQWFLKEVYPKVDNNIKLIITGKGVFDDLITRYPNVDFRGFINREELIQLYNESSLFINPTISGSGVQIKLLEALSYHMNVVSTEYTNTFPHIIDSSNNSIEFANLINENIQNPNHTFNFEEYNRVNCTNFLRIFE